MLSAQAHSLLVSGRRSALSICRCIFINVFAYNHKFVDSYSLISFEGTRDDDKTK